MSRRFAAVNRPETPIHFTDSTWFIRLMEMTPGLVTWTFILGPIVLSIFHPVIVAYFIIAFDLYWLLKAMRMISYLVRGYRKMRRTMMIDWQARLDWLVRTEKHYEETKLHLEKLVGEGYPRSSEHLRRTKDELALLEDLRGREHAILDPREIIHLAIVATYNESRDVLEPTIVSILESNIDPKQIMLIIAYEERGGAEVKQTSNDLIKQYGDSFGYAEAIMHPDGIVGELRGKGGNITYAGRKANAYIEKQGIDPERVIVTTFDADNKPDRQYFPYLSYVYATNPNRIRRSYQPVPMFLNNIWDVPAPMRVIATGNSFYQIMEMMRPHRLRNFSSHAQPLRALIETDFWSVTSPVEDGHQFWRSFYTFNGDYGVEPLYMPVYQDAVLAPSLWRTFVGQYKQLQRWAYGASDFSYVMVNNIKNRNVPLSSKIVQTYRLFEGHVSWSTATLIVTFVAWLPLFLNHRFVYQELAHQLPIIASGIQRIAILGLLIMVSVSIISLPPRPERYKKSRTIFMVLQWVMLPVTGLLFNSLAAIDSQTRLIFGRYLGFNVTEKTRVPTDEATALKRKHATEESLHT